MRRVWLAVALVAAAAIAGLAVRAVREVDGEVATTRAEVDGEQARSDRVPETSVSPTASSAGSSTGDAPVTAAAVSSVVAIAGAPDGEGYLIVESDGTVHAYGSVEHRGDMAGRPLTRAVVGAAVTPSGDGYWLVASDGGIFAFGDAGYFGSTGAIRLVEPIVAMAATPSGRGYWLAASDGGIFAFGDAAYLGSMGAVRLARPVVGMAATPSGRGYWLVASDGGIFAFGDASFHGSAGGISLAFPIIAMSPTPSGGGYRLFAADGGEFDYGDAGYIASIATRGVEFVDATARSAGDGHWFVTRGGQLQQSGLAPRLGAPFPGPPGPVPPVTEADVALEAWETFDEPMAVRARPGDDDALWVAERAGQIVRVELSTGARTTVVDVSALTETSSERGLLGFDFSADGSKLYLDHTNLSATRDVELVEYDLATVPATRRLLLTVVQPFGNHNGGDVHVHDGYVWLSSGDGGSGGDPQNNAQNRSNLLGAILRIDPTPSGGSPYTIPPDNPFVGEAGVREELWSYGLRNPFRIAFDPTTGDMWIADVGQGSAEEINFEPAGTGGRNYGWKRFEGDSQFSSVSAPDPVFPVHTYGHGPACSITGGVVYRGSAIPALSGAYLFADFCTGQISALRQVGGTVTEVADLQVAASGIVQMGTDAAGEVYVVSLNGPIRRLVPG